jgi:hypothetical protein
MTPLNKYQNGKSYKIWSLETDEIYVGSTCSPLHKRMCWHRSHARCSKYNHKQLYQMMNSMGHDAFHIELIEEYPCGCKTELNRREGMLIRELKPSLNSHVAGRTVAEYRKDNAERISLLNRRWKQEHADAVKEYNQDYCKSYYLKNKENLMSRFKNYYETSKEPLLCYHREYRQQHSEAKRQQRKEYYTANKQQILDKNKDYYHKHIDTIREKIREKTTCHVCSSIYIIHNKARHERTQKHLQALAKHTE